MYHAYKDGYSVLPKLRRIKHEEVFQFTLKDQMQFLEAKKDALEFQTCFAEHNMEQNIYETICSFIVENYPVQIKAPYTFSNIAMQIQEDIAIHRLGNNRDWLAAAHVCFPSGWNPVDKIGRTLSEIHTPIPGMNLGTSRKLVETIVNHGPFERFVWGVVFDDRLNFHPRLPKKKFDPDNPALFIHIERQTTIGFPEHNSSLFVLKQHIIRDNIDKLALAESIKSMTEEQKLYKGINECEEELIQYLLS